jgi:uncharacterized protein YlaN (UPF0358 family)
MEFHLFAEWLWGVALELAAPAAGGSGATIAVVLVVRQLTKWAADKRERTEAMHERMEQRIAKLEEESVLRPQCLAHREVLDTKVNSSNQAIDWIKENMLAANERMAVWMTRMSKDMSDVKIDVAVLASRKRDEEGR